MRVLLPSVVGLVVLVALWPLTCMTDIHGGIAECTSAAGLALPWRDGADTWGIATAVVASVLAVVLTRLVVGGRRPRGD